MGATGFKRFRMEDEKKKWKKNKSKCFQGFGERIEKMIRSNPKLKEENTK